MVDWIFRLSTARHRSAVTENRYITTYKHLYNVFYLTSDMLEIVTMTSEEDQLVTVSLDVQGRF